MDLLVDYGHAPTRKIYVVIMVDLRCQLDWSYDHLLARLRIFKDEYLRIEFLPLICSAWVVAFHGLKSRLE